MGAMDQPQRRQVSYKCPFVAKKPAWVIYNYMEGNPCISLRFHNLDSVDPISKKTTFQMVERKKYLPIWPYHG